MKGKEKILKIAKKQHPDLLVYTLGELLSLAKLQESLKRLKKRKISSDEILQLALKCTNGNENSAKKIIASLIEDHYLFPKNEHFLLNLKKLRKVV